MEEEIELEKEQTEKPKLEQDALVLGTEGEMQETESTFKKFSNDLKERIKELSERDKSELCLIKDESRGLCVEMHSTQLNAVDLANVSVQTFNWLQSQRTIGEAKGYIR